MTLNWDWIYETLGMMSGDMREFKERNTSDPAHRDATVRKAYARAHEHIIAARQEMVTACCRVDEIRKAQPAPDPTEVLF